MTRLLTLLVAAAAAAALAVPASAGGRPAEPYVPFVTDFPSGTADARVRTAASGGFDGVDAAVGAVAGLALGGLAAASAPAVRRRLRYSGA